MKNIIYKNRIAIMKANNLGNKDLIIHQKLNGT